MAKCWQNRPQRSRVFIKWWQKSVTRDLEVAWLRIAITYTYAPRPQVKSWIHMNNTELENMADKEREKRAIFAAVSSVAPAYPVSLLAVPRSKRQSLLLLPSNSLKMRYRWLPPAAWDPVAMDRLSLWLKRARLM